MGDDALARSLRRKGISDDRVLEAMASLDRTSFVPMEHRWEALGDYPLPIGHGQTISQPFIVAFMTQALALTGREKVLEVGTGSGYQTALLARLAQEVYSIEFIPQLAEQAIERLRAYGFTNVHVRVGDGHAGWPEAAPFGAILVTAAPARIPPALFEQLDPGGRMVVPVGELEERQELVCAQKLPDGTLRAESLLPVRFVKMMRGMG